MAKETAEKKLLNLIEKEEAKKKSDAGPKGEDAVQEIAKSVKGGGLAALSLPSFLKPLFDLIKGGPQGKTSPAIGLKQINNVLIAGVIVIAGILTLSISQGTKMTNTQVDFSVDAPIAQATMGLLPAVNSVSGYLDEIRRRNIFFPYETKQAEPGLEVALPLENQRIAEKISKFSLVGISWLDSPETATVMIEDTQSSVTHFLKEGDELNGVKIKKIYADRVILGYQDETLTLKL